MRIQMFVPNRAYPKSGTWEALYARVRNHNGKPVWIKLKVTPDLFNHTWESAAGVVRAQEKGYLEIEASFREDKNIYLEVLIDENMGDEDGFGVEPDDYLVGVVAPDGTFIEPLHIR